MARIITPMFAPFSFPKGLLFAGFVLVGSGHFFQLSAQDTGPIPTPNSGSTSTTNAEAGTSDTINFSNAPINNILDIYERLSGKHLVRDAGINSLPPIGINASGLNPSDRLKLIEATLLLNGVAIVPVDEHTAKAIATNGGPNNRNPRNEGVKLYANAADLPAGDEIVSYYMPLNYINPAEAQTIFSQSAPPHGYGAYVMAPSAQAVILTENVGTIRQLIALKELIDVPPARVTSEFVQLSRADAEKVADLLNKMFDPKTAAAAAPAGLPGGPAIVPASLGNDQPMLNEHNLLSGTVQIIPDARSNRILIVTRPVNMPLLKELITQLDQPDIFMVPERRPLKYVLAQDILPALESALAQGKDEEDQAKKDQTTATGANGKPAQAGAAPAASAGGASGSGSVSAITQPLAAPLENNAPTVVTVGKTRLMADNLSNSIIVFGSPDVTSRVFDMIDQLDRKPLQVYLATVIGELTVTEGMEFGIDLLQKYQKVGQGGLASSLVTPGTTTAGSSAVPEPNMLTSALGFPLPTGLTLYGAIGSTLDAYVRALENTNRFKVISRPSVYTTNNKLAVIASGSQVPVPSNITSGFTSTSTSSNNGLTTTASITYQDVLLQLEIIPLINANHEITLKIRQTNNTLGANNDISGNEVPTINTQEINTEITVPDKSTVVIGGLISDTTNRTTSGVPWLSDIPVLGYLFKDTNKTKERDELIIMIQPNVVETDADQIVVNEAEKQRTILGREAVQAASGAPYSDGEMPMPQTGVNNPGLRPAQSSGYNSKSGNAPKTVQTTTTTTTTVVPARSSGPSLVPSLSSPAPDVSNGKMPKIAPPPGSPSSSQ